ncbi:MAG TPA: phosphotransferase [Reyranella sp.]|nr:phosphotransferase [Reyranella sp.]
MADLRSLDVGAVVARAASALSRAAGREIKLADAQTLTKEDRRNLVIRAIAHDGDGEATSVIVKATRAADADPTAEDALRTSGFVREWVARRCLGDILAADAEAGIMVFKDLGRGLQSLVHPLLHGTAQEAETALKSYAEALADLHGRTLGCLERYRATFDALAGTPRSHKPIGWRVEDEAEIVSKVLGHPPPADELALLTSKLRDPGPWLSLVHGDPCPDNALMVDGGLQLIDYEWARPSHALLDGIYWRIGFPTCWCAGRVPDNVAARIDSVYRHALGRWLPLARDDAQFRTESAYMAAVWLFTGLSWRLGSALERDDKWGIWSIRGRLLWYLEKVIAMTESAQVLPGLSECAHAWLGALRSRWPETEPLGYFPAFATSSW